MTDIFYTIMWRLWCVYTGLYTIAGIGLIVVGIVEGPDEFGWFLLAAAGLMSGAWLVGRVFMWVIGWDDWKNK